MNSRLRERFFPVVILVLCFFLLQSVAFSQQEVEQKRQEEETSVTSNEAPDRGLAPFELIKGWRIQLVSVSNEAAAMRFADSLQTLMKSEIQTLFRDNSYKIQIGNFVKRQDAEKYRDRLRKMGFPDAWVVAARVRSGARDASKIELRSPQIVSPTMVDALIETVFVGSAVPETVYVASKSDNLAEPVKVVQKQEKKPDTPAPKSYPKVAATSYDPTKAPGNGWRIQIMSLYYQPVEDAEAVAKNAQAQLGLATYVSSGVKSHKIRMGDFEAREDAENALKQVRRAGFRDAFLIKSYINKPDE
ncbi:MAG: SPOR domain-containing protein [Candidatus Electryonea clarkiae]|nr:SPOR domain-containing protein [Candidatus Electryonea clarkiae]MDP8286368.1 SPOR domain-containing protein [Candidatus Electryonea clarkiae]